MNIVQNEEEYRSIMKYRNINRILMVVTFATILFTICITGYFWATRSADAIETNNFETNIVDGFFQFGGYVTVENADKIIEQLETSKTKIHTFYIASYGGTLPGAKKITNYLNTHNIRLQIGDSRPCFSACVYIAFFADNKNISSNAWLLFHAGISKHKIKLFDFFEFFNLQDLVEDHDTIYMMKDWVKEYSLDLSGFFSQCSNDPFRTIGGLALQWSTIEEIVEGEPSYICDDILFMDADHAEESMLNIIKKL